MMTFLKRFMDDRNGATAVEYALLCALIAIAMITSLSGVASAIAAAFTKVANATPV